jgi:thiol-disulfide isomerase/thioredoxin
MQNNKTLSYILMITGAAILLAVGLSFLNDSESTGSHEYDELASCMADKGVKFYGAFWCPHCMDQKKAFGAASKLLPYVECSTPDSQGQTQVCIDAKVESYPTWEFADGTRKSAVLTPSQLAELSGCEATLPGNASSTAPIDSGISAATSTN